MALGILCSGQGRQHPAMFNLTGEVAAAEPLFGQAASLLGGIDPRALVRAATGAELHHNRIGQVLCTLQALAAATALQDVVSGPIVVAGYSVGELAAWGVAGALAMADTLALAARRAEIMDAVAGAGEGLLFVRGLPRSTVEELCGRHDAPIAIINPGGAFVLGGLRSGLDALAKEATAMHAARVVDVPVEVASHTPRLAKASTEFRDVLGRVAAAEPRADVRLLSGIDGSPVSGCQSGLDKLAAQISHPVQWADCLQGCIEAGVTCFFELGPGGALSEMAAGMSPGIPARCLEDFRTLDGARVWLGGAAGHSR